MKSDVKSFTATGTKQYQLTVQAATGGTVNTNASGKYAANTAVSLVATPNSGYEFAGWASSNGGSFTSVASASTSFTMPAANTTLTAHFKEKITPNTSISAAPQNLDFGSQTEGYAAPAAQTVTITNNGNQTVRLEQPVANNYTIGVLSATTLAPNETATFAISPNTGLSVGTYNESIGVSAFGDVSSAGLAIKLNFAVTEKPVTPSYTITAASAALDFGTVTEGYAAPAAKTVTVTNTGNQTITLNQPTSSSYTISALSSTSLAPNGTATFTVTPKTGLAVGNSNETITISTTDNTSATVSASLTVQAKPVTPTYTITAAPAALDFGTVTEGYAAPALSCWSITLWCKRQAYIASNSLL